MKPDCLLSEDGLELYCGDALSVLSTFADGSVQCCVTSPPYWGLRDYGHEDSLGAEPTPEAYVAAMVAVFGEVRRVLAKDGLLWLNIGDSYAAGGRGGAFSEASAKQATNRGALLGPKRAPNGYKAKDLVGIPWMLAFALRLDGWYLRSDIIWSKPNPMPESVTDRPTKSHEYLFLLAKSQTYYFDQDAVREPFTESTIERISQPTFDQQTGGEKDYANGVNGNRSARKALNNLKNRYRDRSDFRDGTADPLLKHHGFEDVYPHEGGRNIRSVWTIATQPSPLPHFAAFPDALVEPCIKAGSRLGDTVLGPFAGTATTLKVARELGRKAIGIEISPDYCELAVKRLRYGVRGVMAIRDGQGVLE